MNRVMPPLWSIQFAVVQGTAHALEFCNDGGPDTRWAVALCHDQGKYKAGGDEVLLDRRAHTQTEIGRIHTTRGEVVLVAADHPEIQAYPEHLLTFVALAEWMLPGTPVVMFVTATLTDTEGHVGMVCRAGSVRYDPGIDGPAGSVAVQIGSWLFSSGHVTHHSPDRNAEGDRWARRVGGELVPLEVVDVARLSQPEYTERKIESYYQILREMDWTLWR